MIRLKLCKIGLKLLLVNRLRIHAHQLNTSIEADRRDYRHALVRKLFEIYFKRLIWETPCSCRLSPCREAYLVSIDNRLARFFGSLELVVGDDCILMNLFQLLSGNELCPPYNLLPDIKKPIELP